MIPYDNIDISIFQPAVEAGFLSHYHPQARGIGCLRIANTDSGCHNCPISHLISAGDCWTYRNMSSHFPLFQSHYPELFL